jgi:hypothetical protein
MMREKIATTVLQELFTRRWGCLIAPRMPTAQARTPSPTIAFPSDRRCLFNLSPQPYYEQSGNCSDPDIAALLMVRSNTTKTTSLCLLFFKSFSRPLPVVQCPFGKQIHIPLVSQFAMLHTPWRLKRGARQDFGLAVAGRVRVRS